MAGENDNVNSKPGGRVTADDLEDRLRKLVGNASASVEEHSAALVVPVVAAVVGVVLLAFLFGRRRGTKRTTVVEVVRL